MIKFVQFFKAQKIFSQFPESFVQSQKCHINEWPTTKLCNYFQIKTKYYIISIHIDRNRSNNSNQSFSVVTEPQICDMWCEWLFELSEKVKLFFEVHSQMVVVQIQKVVEMWNKIQFLFIAISYIFIFPKFISTVQIKYTVPWNI